MKHFLLLLYLIPAWLPLFAQHQPDSTASKLHLSGNVDLTNNGISPVPAFSLGKPAIMTELSMQKRRFSFTHQFNYGINGKPWSSNNWFRYRLPWKKFTFRAGINWSLFFKQSTVQEDNQTFTVKRVNRYLENELAASYTISDRLSVHTTWWHDEGMDIDAVKRGDFYSLAAEISLLPASKSLLLKLRPHVFYLSNKIPFKGLFLSNKTTLSHQQLPVSLSFQVVQPIHVEPGVHFNWNLALNYSFKNE